MKFLQALLISKYETSFPVYQDYAQRRMTKSWVQNDLFLEEDPSLEKTKEYTWILVSLRQLRNLLARVIASLVSFEANNSMYFDLESDGLLYNRFRECFDQIRQYTAELVTIHLVIEQRIETLEKTSDVVS